MHCFSKKLIEKIITLVMTAISFPVFILNDTEIDIRSGIDNNI